MTATANNGEVALDATSAFGQIDDDGNGHISKQELWAHFGAYGIGEKAFDKLFDAIDKNKNGTIELNEYSSFLEQVLQLYAVEKSRRSSMKVSTLRQSLQKTVETNPPRATLGSIRFTDVEVREYGVTASDNPGVKSGVALELSWDFNIHDRENLDKFEGRRSKERCKNFIKEKKLTRLERERILRDFGATKSEIQAASKRAAIIRNQRRKSVGTRDQDKLREEIENVTDKLKKVNPLNLPLFHHGKSKEASVDEALYIERLHPTLMAMIGVNE